MKENALIYGKLPMFLLITSFLWTGCTEQTETNQETSLKHSKTITNVDTTLKTDKFEFIQIKEANKNKPKDSNKNNTYTKPRSIKSYSVMFNPNGNGSITIVLFDESQYSASSLNGSQLSTVLLFLGKNGVQLTEGKEFKIEEKLL
jgi:hypothetical protein